MKFFQAPFGVLAIAAVACGRIREGAFWAASNTDLALGSQMGYLIYPAQPDLSSTDSVTAKIYKDEDANPVKTVTIPSDKVMTGTIMRIAFGNARSGTYSVKFCKDDDCSDKSSPSAPMDIGTGHKVNCNGVDDTVPEIPIGPITAYGTEAELATFKATPIGGQSYASLNGFTKPLEQKQIGSDWFLYAYIPYDASQYKALYTSTVKVMGQEYCHQKYHLVVLTHVVNPNTGIVEEGFKSTPLPIPKNKWDTYITGNNPEKVPIELKLKLKNQISTSKNIWQTVCAVQRSGGSFGNVKCSKPFIQENWEPSS